MPSNSIVMKHMMMSMLHWSWLVMVSITKVMMSMFHWLPLKYGFSQKHVMMSMLHWSWLVMVSLTNMWWCSCFINHHHKCDDAHASLITTEVQFLSQTCDDLHASLINTQVWFLSQTHDDVHASLIMVSDGFYHKHMMMSMLHWSWLLMFSLTNTWWCTCFTDHGYWWFLSQTHDDVHASLITTQVEFLSKRVLHMHFLLIQYTIIDNCKDIQVLNGVVILKYWHVLFGGHFFPCRYQVIICLLIIPCQFLVIFHISFSVNLTS